MTREEDFKRLSDKCREESKQQVEIDLVKFQNSLFEDYSKWKKLLFRNELSETEKAIFKRGWWYGFFEGVAYSTKLIKG